MNAQDIKKLRTKLGWSQERLAKYLGISIMTISRWENGHFEPMPLLRRALRELANKTGD